MTFIKLTDKATGNAVYFQNQVILTYSTDSTGVGTLIYLKGGLERVVDETPEVITSKLTNIVTAQKPKK
jgi:hypothetical protein